jgi:type I restriction enzyme, S subunit
MSKIYKLTEVVNFIGGSQPPKSVFSDIKKDGYVRLIQIRDYKSDNYIVYINEDSTKKFCTEDDIMIGRYRPPVFQILRGISGAYNVALMKAEPKIDEVSKEYLFRFLQNPSIQNYIIGLSQRSAGQSGVNKEALEQYEILLPSLIEQQRIVSKLDLLFEKIDKSIALHQKNMDEANAFMGSVLNDVFGELEEKYGKTKINDVVVKTNNVNPMNDLDKPFTYIDISSIDNKSFQIVEPKQLIGKEAPSRAKKEVVLGDIVYSTTRPNLKNISIVNKEYDNPIASTGFCVLRVNENTINSYLFYYLITDKLFEQIEPNIRGTQYPATSDKDLKNCNIPNTPLIIQQKVVKYLDEISQKTEKIKQVQKDKMNSLKALKASILDQAFKGEL